jgi:succinoglycan biosynthesis protein ExoA
VTNPSVSAVIVAAAEPASRLQRTIDCLAAQEEVAELEVLIATPPRDAAAVADLRPHGAIAALRAVDNPSGGRSAGLNRALAVARGDAICRVDARSRLPPHYVARCLKRLAEEPSVGIVGGAQLPVPANGGVVARGIARGLANPWALGGAKYRRIDASGPVDTVYLGSFRRKELLSLGGWNEELEANEDFELCNRYRAAGLQVWLEPGLAAEYETRATLFEVFMQYRAFGKSKVRFWRTTGNQPLLRQWLPFAGAGAAIAAVPLMARHPRRAGSLAVVALAAVDEIGSRSPASPGMRAVAWATYVAVWAGFVEGAAEAAVGS